MIGRREKERRDVGLEKVVRHAARVSWRHSAAVLGSKREFRSLVVSSRLPLENHVGVVVLLAC